jgi:hypothetical protein
MKQITKVITIMLTLLLISPFALPAQAQGGNNWPNPNFMASATPAGKTNMPYYDLDATIDIYLSNGLSYYVDEDTQRVVQILREEMNFEVTPTYDEGQLKTMAEKIVYDFSPTDIELGNFSYILRQKIGTYFFRWEDTNNQLDNGTHPFIQVGLSQNGDFLNFVNTMPFGKSSEEFNAFQQANPSPTTSFINDFYANGGQYWSQYGTLISANGGWYSMNPGCNGGAFCSKFYYTSARAEGSPLYFGKWTPQTNTHTRAEAFIPSNNATAVVRYVIITRSSDMITVDINQNAYIDSLAPLVTPSLTVFNDGIAYIKLYDSGYNGTGTSSYKVAWDEVRVYRQTFDDVDLDYWAFDDIERLVSNSITTGCSAVPPKYCPDSNITRAEMAVFLLVSEHGAGYHPPAATGIFTDVPANNTYAPWIEQLYHEGVTGGCSTSPMKFCPSSNVDQAQMAVFLLRTKYGSGYIAPDATGNMFGDVSYYHWAADWIEDAASKGFSYGQHGCAPGNFCPSAQVTRAEKAGMLVRTFNLPSLP